MPREQRGFYEGCGAVWRASGMRQGEKIWANLDLRLELQQEGVLENDTTV